MASTAAAPGGVAQVALHALALPHLVFDADAKLVSLNHAADKLFPAVQLGKTRADELVRRTSSTKLQAPPEDDEIAPGGGERRGDGGARLLETLARGSTAWGQYAVVDLTTASNAPHPVEVAASVFVPPGSTKPAGRDHMYSVLLVRPVGVVPAGTPIASRARSRQASVETLVGQGSPQDGAIPVLRRAESDPVSDSTPTLGSSPFVDPFTKSVIARRRASEASQSPATTGLLKTRRSGHLEPAALMSQDGAPLTIAERRQSSSSTASFATATPDAPHIAASTMAAANSVVDSPTSTKGSSSGGGRTSNGSAYSSASTAATTPPSSRSGSSGRTDAIPPVPEVPEEFRGIGVSVSSAGIHLGHSVEVASGMVSPSRSTGPATTDWSTHAEGLKLHPNEDEPRPTYQPRPASVQRGNSSLHVLNLDEPADSAFTTAFPESGAPPPPSPRPTALPPLPVQEPRAKPDPSELLRFAALANLPHTGVIVADPDLASGYANALARELLMGVPSTDGISKADDAETRDGRSAFEWWQNGCWDSTEEPWSSASAGTQGTSSSSSQPFFTPAAETHDPLDAQEIIKAGEANAVERGTGTGGSGLKIAKPSGQSRHKMNISGILARSLVSEEKRKAALGKVPATGPTSSPPSASTTRPALADLGKATVPSGLTSPASTSSRSSSNYSRQTPQFVSAGGASSRKSYRVFDASFSQRTIDPFGPLLEMVARRGEVPPAAVSSEEEEDEDDDFVSSGRVTNGMLVGVEIEVWTSGEAEDVDPGAATAHNASALKAASFVTANPFANRKKRVRRRVVEVTAAPLSVPLPDGTMQHVGGILLLRDRTDERKRWELSKPASSRKRGKHGAASYHKQILDNLPQMVWTTSPLGSHTYYNQTWYTYTGLEPEESLGVGWQSPFHPDDMESCLKAWSHSLETGDPYSVEYRCRRFDGEWRWFLGRALPFRDSDGTIKGWSGTCTDFEDLYRTREQLRGLLQQNAAVVQGAGCLLIATDCDGRITFFEGAQKEAVLADARFGGIIEGRFLSELDSSPELVRALNEVIGGDKPNVEVAWSRNERSFRCSLTPLTETRNDRAVIVGCIVVAHDITDLVSTQIRLKQSRDKATQLEAAEVAAKEASRLKSEFLALTSHELRTPIAHMLGLSELLLSEELTESQRALVTQLLRSGDVLLELVGQVLDMGKVEAGKLELEIRPFCLNELSTDVGLYAMAAKKKGLAFEEDFDKFGTRVLGDMPRIRQVMVNLLGNAIKFTSHGHITLRIKKVDEDDSSILVRWQVKDTGIGISKEAVPALFQPFHQADVSTSRRFGGTGLGLSISKKLIELMGGTINLDSEYGVGTTMTVEIRLNKVSPNAVSPSTSAAPHFMDVLKKENLHILVVDDNELNRSICTRLLSKAGFLVDSVANGYGALEALERKKYDLALMDNQMEGLDGLQTTIRIRQSNNPQVSQVKIIALTASALKGDRDAFLASGADGYLSKPVRAAVLESTILRTLSPRGSAAAAAAAAASLGLAGTALVGTPPPDSAIKTGFDFGAKAGENGSASYP